MIPREKALQLTAIYLYISDLYESELQFVCQRFSNNNRPEFTDQEIITTYLFVMHSEHGLKLNIFINLQKTICIHGFQSCLRMWLSIHG